MNKKLLYNIYNEIRLNTKVFQKELSKKYSVSERTIRRYCKILKDNGYIKYVISNKNNRWHILKEYSIINLKLGGKYEMR